MAALSIAVVATGCYVRSPTSGSSRALETYRAMDAEEPAVAANGQPNGQLSLTRAIELAKANSASIALEKARADVARAHVREVGNIDNPEIRVGQVRLQRIAERRSEVEVMVRLRPPRPVENAALEAEAEAEVAAAEAVVRAEEARIEADVRLAYATVRILDAEALAQEALVSARGRFAAGIDERIAQSRATALDKSLASADVADAAADAGDLGGERAKALGNLSDLVGASLDDSTELTGDPLQSLVITALPSEKALVERALSHAPELDGSASRIDAFEARAAAERAEQWPWISFIDLGYEFVPVTPTTVDGYGWTFGAGVVVPIFDTNQGAVDTADAAKVEAQRSFEAKTRAIVVAVRARARELRASGDALRRFSDGPVAAEKQARADAKAAMDAGQADNLAVLNAEARTALVELRRLQLVRRYVLAATELQRLTGWAPPF